MIVAPVKHNRDFIAAVAFGLGDPIIWASLLATLDLEMNTGKRLANNVGRICATAELLPTASREAFAGEKLGGFQFTALAFIS